ncbi:uncharacterized protein BX663DRAFT_557456 [Cokeromyces recurvatus]|uniref:uncharacterized protein n=1 Tax=Cokeromyces recurvatus TaxID=90255 RepID=UPI00221F33E3|nr:uncharacterized protein BX663DRAFT_557456 [Cokeromyces recurvatus]KAI7908316.1 hypothetical protein BX663DRAFT_557456 [Cokeromyces recurvatus]
MPRTPIYPEVEHLIFLKKRAMLEKVSQANVHKATKRKDSPAVITVKRSAKRSRQTNTSAASSSKIVRGSSDDVGPVLQAYKDTKKERPAETESRCENRLKNYGQSLSTACETVATTYNNYYVENFENIISNYFIYTLRTKMRKLAVSRTWIYNHIYDQVLTHSQSSSIPNDILALFDPDVVNNLPSFLNPLISEVKNRMSKLPVSKESLNNEPFKILSALRAYP